MQRIGIRREDKNLFERRVPLIPAHVRELGPKLEVVLQPSPRRIFSDEEFRAAGVMVSEDLDACPIILGVKEIPAQQLSPRKTYVFFSHTIKGQPYNMPMLRRIMELGCTLIDYEKIVDEYGRRLVFFGRHAGLAGMIDTLWALGQRLANQGMATPFARLRPAHAYASLDEAKREIVEVGVEFRTQDRPSELGPLVFGLAGYGNVSVGAQEILGLLSPVTLHPSELGALEAQDRKIYKVVFREEHLVEPLSGAFDLHDYYARPESYRPVFSRYLDHLTVLVNCIYWEPRYPRLITLEDLRRMYGEKSPRLRVIGDISCDVDGSIEATVRATSPDNPVFVYDVKQGKALDGFAGRGPVIMAVDNLPAELPREASEFFSAALLPFMPGLATADFSSTLDRCGLPEPLRRAVIVYRGALAPSFSYLSRYL